MTSMRGSSEALINYAPALYYVPGVDVNLSGLFFGSPVFSTLVSEFVTSAHECQAPVLARKELGSVF